MRTIRQSLVAASVVLLLLASASAAQDMSGTWVLAVDLGATGGGDATFVLEQDGLVLTGTYSGALGEHPLTGAIDGETVTLEFEVDQVGRVTYTGTVSDRTYSGTCEYGQLGSGTFSGEKGG